MPTPKHVSIRISAAAHALLVKRSKEEGRSMIVIINRLLGINSK